MNCRSPSLRNLKGPPTSISGRTFSFSVRYGFAAGVAAGALMSVACGTSGVGKGNSGFSSGQVPGAGGSGTLSGATGSSSSAGSIAASSGSGSGSLGAGAGALGGGSGAGPSTPVACASESRKGQTLPVDIFIMMDQSGSMTDEVTGPNGTMGMKWDFLKQAFTSFVEDPASAGIGIGIQYFPIPNIDDSSCDAGTYAVPNDPNAPPSGVGVAIAPLPGNAAAIVNSLSAHTPGGQTPTVAALSGALQYAEGWATQNPTHKVIVVFATDGDPHGCTNNTVDVAAAVAQMAATGVPPVPTYVIGVGDSLKSLNQIADAGGTSAALIVSTGQDVAAQFLAAMNEIRTSTSVPCVLSIPTSDGGAVDFGKVNVVDSPADGGAPRSFLQVPNASSCDPAAGGWFYDNRAAPTTITLCPASCTMVTTDVAAQIDIQLGCQTLVAPPR